MPRQFLRELVNRLDLVDEQPRSDPMVEMGFVPDKLTPDEQLAMRGHSSSRLSREARLLESTRGCGWLEASDAYGR